MRSDAPPLLPIFRSRHQADLLALMLLEPNREFTATELAGRLDVALPTAHREAQRLEGSGLITSRPVGRTRLLRANVEHRAYGPLAQLLTVTFGPHLIVAEEFADLAGAEVVLIYGSWAGRYEGEAGGEPNDLDVLVVGQVDRAEVYDAADRVEQRLGFPVNPTIRSAGRWQTANDALVEQVKASPVVEVINKQATKGKWE